MKWTSNGRALLSITPLYLQFTKALFKWNSIIPITHEKITAFILSDVTLIFLCRNVSDWNSPRQLKLVIVHLFVTASISSAFHISVVNFLLFPFAWSFWNNSLLLFLFSLPVVQPSQIGEYYDIWVKLVTLDAVSEPNKRHDKLSLWKLTVFSSLFHQNNLIIWHQRSCISGGSSISQDLLIRHQWPSVISLFFHVLFK